MTRKSTESTLNRVNSTQTERALSAVCCLGHHVHQRHDRAVTRLAPSTVFWDSLGPSPGNEEVDHPT